MCKLYKYADYGLLLHSEIVSYMVVFPYINSYVAIHMHEVCIYVATCYVFVSGNERKQDWNYL